MGDPALRPSFDAPEWNGLTDLIAKLAGIKKGSRALNYGGFRSLALTNRQCVYEREFEGERIITAINIDENPYVAHFDARSGQAVDLMTGEMHDFGGGSELPPYSLQIWRVDGH